MNDALPKVAILVHGTEEYGVGQVAMTLATGLRGLGSDARMITFEEGAITQLCRASGVPYHVLDLPPWPRYERGKWKTIAAMIQHAYQMRQASRVLATCLGEISADALVVQWPTHVELGGRACRSLGIACHWAMAKVIGNRWPLGMSRRYFRYLCHRFHITPLPNSQYTANSLGSGTAKEILYLGVDETRFAPERVVAKTRAELNLPADACVAAVFARIDSSKGQTQLWQAMVELIGEGHNLHLLLVGGPTDGPVASALRSLAKERKAAGRLHFAGWTDEPERYYGAVDFAVSPGLVVESFGLAAVEAMMMGRPVLVHAFGGPAETVVDGVTGWHVGAPTVDAFAAGLRRAVGDRAKWKEMGEAGQRRALEHFSATAFVANYLRITGPTLPNKDGHK